MANYDPDLLGQEYHSCNTVQLRPQENVTQGAFAGMCTFVLDIAKDEVYFPQSAYLSARITIESSTSAGVVLPLGMLPVDGNVALTKPFGCISSGGVINMFSKLSHEIGGLSGSTVVQNIENLPQCNGLLRATHEIPTARNNRTDIYNLLSTDTISTTYTTDFKNVSSKIDQPYGETDVQFVARNALKQGLNFSNQVSLTARLPLAMFLQESKLYQGQHIIRLTIDPNYRQNLVDVITVAGNGAASDAMGVVTKYAGSYQSGEIIGNSIVRVNVEDIYFNIEFAKINKRPMGTKMLSFESFNTTLHSFTQSNSDNFILPCKPHLLRLIMGIQTPSALTDANNGTRSNANALINPVGMFGFNKINLNRIRIKYLSDVYPQTDYSLSLINAIKHAVGDRDYTLVNRVTNAITYDAARAYEDYYNSMEFENSGEAMTFQEWLLNPIFTFKFCSTTNLASNVEVFVNCNDSITNTLNLTSNAINGAAIGTTSELSGSILYMLYVYRTIVEVNYGEDSVNYKVFNLV